jgi:hypothetical protein
MIDLERIATIRRTRIEFPRGGAWHYRTEVAEQPEGPWQSLADQTQTAETGAERVDEAGAQAPQGRFLRITITGTPSGAPAAVAEIEAHGTLESP